MILIRRLSTRKRRTAENSLIAYPLQSGRSFRRKATTDCACAGVPSAQLFGDFLVNKSRKYSQVFPFVTSSSSSKKSSLGHPPHSRCPISPFFLCLLPSFAESHGCKPVDECEVGTLRSLGARPSQPKRLLRRSRQGGYASAFAVRGRLRPTKAGGFRPTRRVERCHGRKAVGLHANQLLYPVRRSPSTFPL